MTSPDIRVTQVLFDEDERVAAVGVHAAGTCLDYIRRQVPAAVPGCPDRAVIVLRLPELLDLHKAASVTLRSDGLYYAGNRVWRCLNRIVTALIEES